MSDILIIVLISLVVGSLIAWALWERDRYRNLSLEVDAVKQTSVNVTGALFKQQMIIDTREAELEEKDKKVEHLLKEYDRVEAERDEALAAATELADRVEGE